MQTGTNLNGAWATGVVDELRNVWNARLPEADYPRLLADGFVFHFHDQDLHGAAAFAEFVRKARQFTTDLEFVPVRLLGTAPFVAVYYHWSSVTWHPDIVGATERSNFGKIVLRIVDGKIAEAWEQGADFVFLLGKDLPVSLMAYPTVVTGNVFMQTEEGVFATQDAETIRLCDLFRKMNECFLGKCPIDQVKEVQEPDIRFEFDGGRKHGEGIEGWKAFAYASRTASRGATPFRFDDVFIRQEHRLYVYSRCWLQSLAPHVLGCTTGIVASLHFETSPAKIKTLHTFVENYISFLGVDFTEHDRRTLELFRGKRPAIPQPATRSTPIAVSQPKRDAVAIVGMAGRFPQCSSISEFWDLLVNGRSGITETPADRPFLKVGTKIRHAGFLKDADRFDAAFFDIPPVLAEYMDPQQRLLMEVVWQSIEDSGHRPEDFSGARTALFVSSLSDDYKKLLQDADIGLNGFYWMGNETAMFPAKIARFLDIQGPCQFLNAECSSGLFALHEASGMIRRGEVDQAIVGGVNLFMHPYGFAVRQDQLLSDEPLPRLFSRQSKGQLRGEAAVSIVLKSLEKAEQDGDTIYGIIAGSAVNNSGDTLSIVAPHVEQQAKALVDAWRDAAVNPADGLVLECQASGVREGDFAEVAALRRALKIALPDRSAAARWQLTTGKGAIGHGEAASGLSALVKVLLQLRHENLIGIQGLDEPDPGLDLDRSGFDLVKTPGAWVQPASGQPRVAGISAFATGGYNAHVVVREFVPKPAAPDASLPKPQLCTFSARTVNDLRAQLRDIHKYLSNHGEVDLARLAYTLQVGRKPMAFRAALVASTIAELREKIGSLSKIGPKQTGIHFGSPAAKPVKGAKLSDEVIAQRDLDSLAAHWCQGGEMEWESLWLGQKVQRLAGLPGYPFAGQRFGLPGGRMWSDVKGPATRAATLHPFLGVNSSTLQEQRFSTTFTGQESFFTDHVVNGQPVFPASACLEMARAAVQLSSKAANVDGAAIQLLGVTWTRPLTPAPGMAVHIRLKSEASGDILFEIYREATVASAGAEIFCQGRARVGASTVVQTLELDKLRSACPNKIAGSACYEQLRQAGMVYGPAHQAIETMHMGEDRVCARLLLPAAALRDEFYLNPSLVDGAIQSLQGFGTVDRDGNGAKVGLAPFSVELVEIHGPCPDSAWAIVQAQPAETNGSVRKFDVDLCDDAGRVSVRLKGLACRAFNQPMEPKAVPAAVASKATNGAADPLAESAIRYFKKEIASVLRTTADQLDADAPLENFGIDSALAVALTQHLEKTFGVLDKTLFFEVRTVRELAAYFLNSFRNRLEVVLGPVAHGANDSSQTAASPIPVTSRFAETVASPAEPNGAMDIAIIGLSGRYPGARTLEAFWDNLRAGRDCITEIPKDRWNHDDYFDPEKKKPGTTYSKWGGFLDGVDEFDARFFNISAWEAEMMDPQERLFLECAFSAIEDAGYTREGMSSQGNARVGVYVGVMYEEYQLYGAAETAQGRPLALFGSPASIANRVSYFCNFRGPSLAVDTMCSSSLTAIHLACQSLMRGECGAAVAGGVNVSVHPNKYVVLGQGRFVSSKGRCESFGEGAEGYVPGEGVGSVILKPLAAAVADGDRIYGVIKATAVNHGGKNNGYTVPNPVAQAEVIELALRDSGISPRTISYVEAHGTGTSLGDPIEIAGLKKAFAKYTDARGFCAIGSVKSNIGHCESAAGIAGLTKVLLQMEHGQIAPSLHSSTLNPNIDFARSPFVVQQELAEWPRPVVELDGVTREYPRRAGLSSFGAGGSNAHIIIEEYSATVSAPGCESDDREVAIVLSAKTETALRESATGLLDFLQKQNPERGPTLGDLAYTLQTGREAMDERLAFVARNQDEVAAKLASFLAGESTGQLFRGRAGKNQELLSVFSSDDQLQAVVASWAREGNYAKLLELWVRGLNVAWDQIQPGEKPRRVRLPGYSFARERHWILKSEVKPATAGFDGAFYEQLLDEVAEGKVSVEQGVAREQRHVQQTHKRF